MTRETIFHSFFLGLFLLVLYQFLVIAEPFLTPLLGATVLAIVAFPIHRGVARLCSRLNDNAKAALSTLAIITVLVVPFAGLIWLVVNESARIVPLVQDTVTQVHRWYEVVARPWLEGVLPAARRLPLLSRLSGVQLQKESSMAAGLVFGKVSAIGPALAANALITTINLIVLVFALFFLLRDGERSLVSLRKWLPMQSRDKERIIRRVEQTVLGVVRGSVLTALFQMLTATIGYFIVGIPAAVTLGLVTGLATVVPIVGTALIWVPTAIYLLLFSATWKGVFLAIWGTLFVSLLDNILRTYLIGREARIPLFLLFIGLIGGLRVYGLRGMLLGPLLVAILPVLMDIFETQYFSQK